MEVELILYAVPTGPLGDAIGAFFGEVAARPTKAQQYPPHCTLTGFFHDDADTIGRYVAAAARAARPVTIDVVQLRTGAWIGLELRSPDLERLTRDFAACVDSVGTRRDTIRVKDWLHLSLAYGHDEADVTDLVQLATKLVDPAADVSWDLRLYERRNGEWIVHGSWPLRDTKIA